MPFQLTDEETLIQSTMRTWAEEEHGLQAAADLDRHDRFPIEALGSLSKLGILPIAQTAGATAMVLAVMEVAAVCPTTAAVLAAHSMSTRVVVTKPELAEMMATTVCAWLETEEAYGSDKRRYGTTAIHEDNHWVLDGQKAWGVAASDASEFLVMAQTPDGPACFHVPASTEGVQIGRNEPLLGLRGCGIRTVYLTGVKVGNPVADVDAVAAARPWFTLAVSAALLGCVEGARRRAEPFAETRVQFRAPVGSFQAVSDQIVAIDVQLAAARALLLEAASHVEAADAAVWAARAKEAAHGVAVDGTRRALRVMGGTGFMREGGAERFARDARALQMMGEPFAVHRSVIKAARIDV